MFDQIDSAATPPQGRQEPVEPRWTRKRFVVWLQDRFGQKCCRETVRKVLKSFGFSCEGYGGSVCGQRCWVSSSSPGLAKVSCYGVYFYHQVPVKIYPDERANSESTVAILKQIRHELPH